MTARAWMRRGAGVTALAALLAAGGCTTAPVAGELSVDLATPNNDDGALLVKITGNTASTVTGVSVACSGCRIFSAVVSDTEVRAVITGAIAAGTVARVSVPTSTRRPTTRPRSSMWPAGPT